MNGHPINAVDDALAEPVGISEVAHKDLQYPIELDREAILSLLPHRGTMQLVTSVTVLADDHFVGRACWSPEDVLLQGHFPGLALIPGVLLIELVAQVAGAGMRAGSPAARRAGGASVGMLAGVRKCSFRRPVRPSEALVVDVRTRAMGVAAAAVTASVRAEDHEAAQIEIFVISTPREALETLLDGRAQAAAG